MEKVICLRREFASYGYFPIINIVSDFAQRRADAENLEACTCYLVLRKRLLSKGSTEPYNTEGLTSFTFVRPKPTFEDLDRITALDISSQVIFRKFSSNS